MRVELVQNLVRRTYFILYKWLSTLSTVFSSWYRDQIGVDPISIWIQRTTQDAMLYECNHPQGRWSFWRYYFEKGSVVYIIRGAGLLFSVYTLLVQSHATQIKCPDCWITLWLALTKNAEVWHEEQTFKLCLFRRFVLIESLTSPDFRYIKIKSIASLDFVWSWYFQSKYISVSNAEIVHS